MYTIQNSELSVTVSPVGAELQSVRDVRSATEYLWQGDSRWWSGRSPILFPIVGGLWNGTCRLGDTTMQLAKHGFVRRRPWRMVEHEAQRVRFELVGTVGDYAVYPFAFSLSVTYRVEGRKVLADFEVRNLGGSELYFQLGGHPALNLPGWCDEDPVDGYLQLEGSAESVVRVGEQGCWLPERHAVPREADGLVPLSVDTFAHEALIFDQGQVSAATLLDKQRRPVARVESSAPVWLFWSPQGVHTPFVCCEPWYGLCDAVGFEGSLPQRPYMQCAPAGGSWQGGFSIEVLDAAQ